jgi:hypothetical protein
LAAHEGKKMKAKLLLVLGMMMQLASVSAYAGITDGAGVWTGVGNSYDDEGIQIASYQIQLTNTALDGNTIETSGTLTLADGSTQNFWQLMQGKGDAFSIQSKTGKGGGRCFSQGLCAAYETSANGHGTSINIVYDNKDSMRLLITELDGLKAVGFSSEMLTRKQ